MRIFNPPNAAALMATARSFGNYDLGSALADLIDNSIDADASTVDVSFAPAGEDFSVRIRDDGRGMAPKELIEAMRPASSNPEADRLHTDLGRFGWGLKSASLSQARVLTVVSWQRDHIASATWDLDDLADGWQMNFLEGGEAQELLIRPIESPTGTEVIWKNCDRVLESSGSRSTSTLDDLNEKISHSQRHLSLVFHRYLSKKERGSLEIVLQGNRLLPIDPFMSEHPATQGFKEEIFPVHGGDTVIIKPYIVPHFSKLTTEEKNLLGGDEGLIRNQGFYIYRNARLIIYGTWFRLVPHGELSQLLRIRVDLPDNTQDIEWKITLDKSDAQLPIVLRPLLKRIIEKLRIKSVSVHRKKGVVTGLKDSTPVWNRVVHHGKVKYSINREHPILEALFEMDQSDTFNSALKIIESYLPFESMVSDQASLKVDVAQSIVDPEEFAALINNAFLSFKKDAPKGESNREAFLDLLRATEPFSSHWSFVESYVNGSLFSQAKG